MPAKKAQTSSEACGFSLIFEVAHSEVILFESYGPRLLIVALIENLANVGRQVATLPTFEGAAGNL